LSHAFIQWRAILSLPPIRKSGKRPGRARGEPAQRQNWAEAWKLVHEIYGQPPRTCHSCFQQCYAEPSLMQAKPLTWLLESLRSGVDLSTYARDNHIA